MFKIKGLEELQNNLNSISKAAKGLDGEHNLPISELLTTKFISQHTSFLTLDEMFAASGFQTESQEAFEAVPKVDLDNYIRSVSNFDSWQSMLSQAMTDWAKAKLGF